MVYYHITGFFVVQLFRLLIICLCLGVSSLAQASSYQQNSDTVIADFTIEQHSTIQVNLTLDPSLTHQVDFLTCNVTDTPSNTLSSHSQNSSQGHNVNLGVGNSSRMANLARHEPEEVFPVYELALEIPAIPAEQLTIGYQEKPKPSVDWALYSYSSVSRVSAWKESNLLYSHRLFPAA
ncbi:hypothetical protein VF_0876 [Aliivibrio fischeri ES114]|uniref:Uncharacterized protein n=1 Tax=Aliivibrio fischeri (strain ATCC 700601 / ES114) TaxID=312309 RepID=Q5E6H5_ALIF1|nr:hypothetical protein [Aliivibrio fischeri]AAW85371.1 hypothetical protein VF_0876 [Aliivibrio fischeri ES114]MUI53653.1 hypothetical protein [Aliivibrio fischeri]MUJ20723.1 hypothetical protein [Aliivibrio fischeri]MUJ28437.1 hypothetical protein [Aliivibrio fischeri]MUJ36164.1 hypothetical protein [Aliivibrio fischeri]